MDEQEISPMAGDDVREAVRAFYDLHPYPPPAGDLEEYRRRWQDEVRRRADFHLHWPKSPYREDLTVLVAGCGASQAAKHALRQPAARVVGIDISQTSIGQTEALKSKYHLSNLEIHQLPVERAAELGLRFNKVVCTGVLHHLPDPEAGLRALREVMEPGGAIHLMVYAAYGRAGVYMIQEYCRRLGIGHSDREIRDLAQTLTALPHAHPLARLLGESPDFQRKDALADALLNPQDRAYTVPQLFDLIERCGLTFGRWLRQAPYLPQCGSLSQTPHAARLAALPPREQYAAAELFRGTMLRHSLIAYRDDGPGCSPGLPGGVPMPLFDGEDWLAYTPIRLPETAVVQKRLPPGAAAVLVNQTHTDPDLFLAISEPELRLVEAIDGRRSIAQILDPLSSSGPAGAPDLGETAKHLFERLWWYDQVVFDASPPAKDFTQVFDF